MYKNTVRVLPLAMVDDLNGISKCGLDSIALNSFMNAQIEMKKLRFHVPNKDGKSKCHKMHIGQKHENCPVLKVHGTVMESVTEDTYLGDIISSDGKNSKNVAKRISKGIGIITQILHLLEMVSLGEHFVEIFILFRESMFINGILTNTEIWYSLKKNEVKEFEDLDRNLLTRIFQGPVSTPQEAFYLELGILPIGVIIKARRINYLQYLVTRSEHEMLYKFFICQWYHPVRGDWTETVKEDLKDFDIPCDFQFFKSKSKESFKRLVKIKAKEYALKILMENQQKHSKMKNNHYSEMKPQKYLSLKNINIDQIRNVFKFRTRMAPFGDNFREGKELSSCPLCNKHLDVQAMSFQCEALKMKVDIQCDMKDILNEDISIETAKTITDMMKVREEILKKKKRNKELKKNQEVEESH